MKSDPSAMQHPKPQSHAQAGTPDGSARDTLADALRGFALLGIIVVNAPFIGISSNGFTDASLLSVPDRVAAFAVVAFAQAKFYLLFSFLFGYSMSYVLKENTRAQRRAYRRRLFGLAFLGLAHGALFYAGDILLLYALLGTVMLVLSSRSDQTVLGSAAVCALLWGLSLLALALSTTEDAAANRAWQAYVMQIDKSLATGSFWEAVGARMRLWPFAQFTILVLNGLAVLGLFCIGLVAGRHQCLRRPHAYETWWRRGIWLGLLVGLPGALISAVGLLASGQSVEGQSPQQMGALAVGFVTAPALSAGYVSVIAMIHIRKPAWLALFRPAGRMSLTCYLSESVLLAALFCGFGLGLMGQWGAAAVTAAAVGVWLVIDLAAYGWQRYARRGPAEGLLHWWTMGRTGCGATDA